MEETEGRRQRDRDRQTDRQTCRGGRDRETGGGGGGGAGGRRGGENEKGGGGGKEGRVRDRGKVGGMSSRSLQNVKQTWLKKLSTETRK